MAHVITTNKAKRSPERPMGDQDKRPLDGMTTVLCLGLSSSMIMTVLELVPDVDLIFVIDEFNEASSPDGELSGLYDEITRVLKEGKMKADMSLEEDEHLTPMPIIEKAPFHYLSAGKGEICADARYRERDPAIKWNWRLRFKYGGKERVLMRFDQSYKDAWPKGVERVQHIMIHGVTSLGELNDELSTAEKQQLMFNFDAATNNRPYRLYGLTCRHAFPHNVVVQCGMHARGTSVGYVDVKRDETIMHVIKKYCIKYSATVSLDVLSTGKVYTLKWSKSRLIF
jgi:hypothetical protein